MPVWGTGGRWFESSYFDQVLKRTSHSFSKYKDPNSNHAIRLEIKEAAIAILITDEIIG